MIPIARQDKKKFDLNTLTEDVIKKSKDATKNKKVLAHSILLYSNKNPYISKLLRDYDFYLALNNTSNRYLNIYHAESKKPESPINTIGFMTSMESNIYTTPGYSETIDVIKKKFGFPTRKDTPILVLFYVQGENIKEVYGIEICNNSIDAAYNDLLQIVNSIKSSVENVTDDNINNQLEIFNLAITNLKTFKKVRALKRFIGGPVFQLLGLI